MIIVNLKGGLGNQMFQYALGRHLAIKHNTILKLDTTSLTNAKELGNIYRPFALNDFSIQSEIATSAEIQKLRFPCGVFSKLKDTFTRKILRQGFVVFDEKVLNKKDNIYLDGYWQSPKYFEAIRDTLLTDFTLTSALSPSGELLKKHIEDTTAVALHVRRGDYVENKRVLKENGVCSVAYYQKAIETITAKVSNPTFFIFSDDIEWAKANLNLPIDSIFVSDSTLTAPQELFLMSICKHNIIANSSFSWWGAWLNQNRDKVVIAPTPWFDTIIYDQNLIPTSWIQLPKN